jgi:Nucleotidyl transferase AbiEii toxin, Type IV TA system
MTGRFEPRLSILPEAQKRLWPVLVAAPRLGFVLYGGTAIALRLGHRASVDFDFFTEKLLDKTALWAAFPFIERSQLLQDQPDTLTVNVPDQAQPEERVKVSFFGGIGFGRYAVPDTTSDGILQVAALDDLMATKVKVLLQRVEAKDYRDIAAMLEAGVALDRGLAIAQAMYGNQFQPAESLKAMTYFEGGDLNVLTDREKRTLIKAVSVVRELPSVNRVASELSVPIIK